MKKQTVYISVNYDDILSGKEKVDKLQIISKDFILDERELFVFTTEQMNDFISDIIKQTLDTATNKCTLTYRLTQDNETHGGAGFKFVATKESISNSFKEILNKLKQYIMDDINKLEADIMGEIKNILPVVGQTYNYFDDGKFRPSRIMEVVITEIIPFAEIDNETLNDWKEEVEEYDWLYNQETDYFVKADLKVCDNHIEKIIFVRTISNGWFSIGYWGGLLDIDGSLYDMLHR